MSFILLYGKPGSGKTTLAASMTKLGYNVHFLDADNKVQNMVNLQPLLRSGKLTAVGLQSKLTASTLRQKMVNPKIALLKQPQGYLEFVDLIDALEKAKQEGQPPPAEVLVIDSLTSVIEHFKRLAMHFNASSPKFDNKMQFDQWNVLLANLEELFTTLQTLLGWFKHIIVICHERTDTEQEGDNTIVTGILPAIEGSMRDKVGKYFEEVYNCRIRQAGKDFHYEVMTKPVSKYMARTSRDLKVYEESDFSKIFTGEVKKSEAKA